MTTKDEQPAQQEPVAWMDIDENGTFSGLRYWSEPDNRYEVALYTSPQRTWVHATEWRGLTDEEIWAMDAYTMAITDQETRWLYRLARAIEAKLKEKNSDF